MMSAMLCIFVAGLVLLVDVLATGNEGGHALGASQPLSRTRRAALPNPVDIGMWNLKIFGDTKMSVPARAEIIANTTKKYAIFGIIETRDSDGSAQNNLASMVGPEYGRVESQRLGTSAYNKESYLVFYRLDTVSVVATHQYPVTTTTFSREPFTVLFRPTTDPCSNETAGFDFAVSFFHARPANACTEIAAHIDVYNDIVANLNTTDVILSGDFNADCTYCSPAEIDTMEIKTNSTFNWVITHAEDTTTSNNTDCAYDRFILSGPNIMASYVNGSAGIFNFTEAYSLTQEGANNITDHYVIKMKLA